MKIVITMDLRKNNNNSNKLFFQKSKYIKKIFKFIN